ncbi:MAG TPA: ATP-binding protein [Gemmataceae bacterium]|nr:ATP-binding protein [Gemmataceae bacterium]
MQSRLMARLTAPIAAVSLVLLTIALGAAWYIHSTQQAIARLLTNDVASVRAAQELEISIRRVQMQFDRYLITGERTHLEGVPAHRDRAFRALEAAERLAFTEPEKALMQRVRHGYEHFFAEYDKLTASPPPQGVYARIIELNDKVLMPEVLEPTREYLRLNEGMLAKSTETNQEMSRRLTFGLIGLGVCGAVGGLLGGWAIAAALRRSLAETEEALRETAAKLLRAAGVAPSAPALPDASAVQQVTQSASAVLTRLKQTERDALRAEQLAWVGQMAAGIAHEVRNPLMAIKLLVQAAADSPRPDAFRSRDLEVLEEEILRLEDIISLFLDFARPARPDKKPVEARGLLESSLERVRTRAGLQGVDLRLDAPDQPITLDADPNQLRQVLYNLLYNALDALPVGGTITVTAAGSGPLAVLRVEDTGPGLAADIVDRIFDPFVSTKTTGLGLGLSICRRIVEAHGGTIEAGNTPGGGARFTVRLPTVRVSDVLV